MKMFLPLVMLAQSAFGYSPDARFEVYPAEGEVISIGCNSEDNDECRMDTFQLSQNRGTEKKTKKLPGIGKAPKKVVDALESAAEALDDTEYVHVAVTYDGITYEYMYDRETGSASLRS